MRTTRKDERKGKERKSKENEESLERFRPRSSDFACLFPSSGEPTLHIIVEMQYTHSILFN